jgi:hypothetical protein
MSDSIPRLILNAAYEEMRLLLQRIVTRLVARLDEPAPTIRPVDERKIPHKNLAEAMGDTFGAVAEVRSETRERRKWAFKMTDEPADQVAAQFDRPGGITRVGHNTLGKRLVAVWRGPGEVPDSEPSFG